MENLEIYEKSRSVPDAAKKAFNNGKFSGTDINPMWRIKKLTELFGPAGVGWYYDVLSERAEEHGEVTIAIVDLNLYIKVNDEWSKPIFGTGGNILLRKGSTSDEGYKMALTDALSVACKALGIGADVYFEKDKTKYTAPPEPQKKDEAALKFRCAHCGNELKVYQDAQGVPVSIRKHAEGSKSKFGAVYCIDCIKAGNTTPPEEPPKNVDAMGKPGLPFDDENPG